MLPPIFTSFILTAGESMGEATAHCETAMSVSG
jgi:hypothetical protein